MESMSNGASRVNVNDQAVEEEDDAAYADRLLNLVFGPTKPPGDGASARGPLWPLSIVDDEDSDPADPDVAPEIN